MRYDVSAFDRMISRAERIAVFSHLNPDGDAVGSLCACCTYLAARGKDFTPILPNAVPDFLKFLSAGGRQIVICEEDPRRAKDLAAAADLLICLDVSSPSRTEYLAEAIISSGAAKILIDHHIDPQSGIFDLVYSEPEISSTCELLFWLLMEMPDVAGDVNRLTMPCAEALYTGMMTDTNNFSNSVVPSTFEMAARLIARGVDKIGLQYKVLNSYNMSRLRLLGRLVNDCMHVFPQHGATCMLLSEEDKSRLNFRPGDTEGFVNIPLQVADVRISGIFTEDKEGGYVRVSLRSKRGTDVNTLARRFFNGGGHENAAGGRIYMPLKEVPAYFLSALDQYFGKK